MRTGSAQVSASEAGGVQEETATTTETTFDGVVEVVRSAASTDVALLLWPVVIAAVAVAGGLAAWKRHRLGVWASGLSLLAIAALGSLSFGVFVVPSAAAMLLSAGLLHAEERREEAAVTRDESAPTRTRTDRPGTVTSGTGASLLIDKSVLGLFLILAAPLTLIQVFDIDVLVVSILALPGYIPLITLAGIVSGAGFDAFVGTPGFYALNVAWTYLLSLAAVATVRYVAAALE